MVAGELRWKFQSTPPVKAATISYTLSVWDSLISIHAAREGGDHFVQYAHDIEFRISIHAAREGGDRYSDDINVDCIEFQSTPPVKAATNPRKKLDTFTADFNPRRP